MRLSVCAVLLMTLFVQCMCLQNDNTVQNQGRSIGDIAGFVLKPVWGFIQDAIKGIFMTRKKASTTGSQLSHDYSSFENGIKNSQEKSIEEESDENYSLEYSFANDMIDKVQSALSGSSTSSEESSSEEKDKDNNKNKVPNNTFAMNRFPTINGIPFIIQGIPQGQLEEPCSYAKQRIKRHKNQPVRNIKKRKTRENAQSKQNWFGSWFAGEQSTKKRTTTTEEPGWLDTIFFDDTTESPATTPTTTTTTKTPGWFINLFSQSESKPQITVTPEVTTTTHTWFDSQEHLHDDINTLSQNSMLQEYSDDPRRKITYKDYQLYRIRPLTKYALGVLEDLYTNSHGTSLQWWTGGPALNVTSDLLVPPALQTYVKEYLDGEGMGYTVTIRDLQKVISYDNPRLTYRQKVSIESTRGHPLTWIRYHRYVDILQYLQHLSIKFPGLVQLETIGRSYEGRPLVVAKVSLPSAGAPPSSTVPSRTRGRRKVRRKPAVWIDAGMHAREWITPAAATWMLKALVEGEKGDGSDRDMGMLRAADWFILTVGNPDGYEYTHTKDRFWRKTRSRHAVEDSSRRSRVGKFLGWNPFSWLTPRGLCIGVDPNRNWGYHWGEKGASEHPCSDTYAGPKAFSEPETKAVARFIAKNKQRLKVFLTLHSYSQMWLMPWGYTRTTPKDHDDMMEMANLAAAAARGVDGTKFQVGTAPDILYATSGSADDWAKGSAGIKYSYTVEMRDRGEHGFLLPPEQIIPASKEIWAGIRKIVENL